MADEQGSQITKCSAVLSDFPMPRRPFAWTVRYSCITCWCAVQFNPVPSGAGIVSRVLFVAVLVKAQAVVRSFDGDSGPGLATCESGDPAP